MQGQDRMFDKFQHKQIYNMPFYSAWGVFDCCRLQSFNQKEGGENACPESVEEVENLIVTLLASVGSSMGYMICRDSVSNAHMPLRPSGGLKI